MVLVFLVLVFLAGLSLGACLGLITASLLAMTGDA